MVAAAERREAEHDIAAVIVRLAQLGDRKEAVRAAELFTADGSWKRAGVDYTGTQQLVDSYDRVSPPTAVVRHCVLGSTVTVEDSTHATVLTYYCAFRYDEDTVTHELPVPLDVPFAMGEWHDRCEKTPDGWKIARRETERVFQRRP